MFTRAEQNETAQRNPTTSQFVSYLSSLMMLIEKVCRWRIYYKDGLGYTQVRRLIFKEKRAQS